MGWITGETVSRAAGRTARPARALTVSHPGPADNGTASLDNLRTGWDPGEPGLSPAVVHGSSFGEVFSAAVKGQDRAGLHTLTVPITATGVR